MNANLGLFNIRSICMIYVECVTVITCYQCKLVINTHWYLCYIFWGTLNSGN